MPDQKSDKKRTPADPDVGTTTQTGIFITAMPKLPKLKVLPITQEKPDWRAHQPAWVQQLPRLRFPPPNTNFQLIDLQKLDEVMKGFDPVAIGEIKDDMTYLEEKIMPYFRSHDHAAKYQQNRYRLYQITYIVLSAIATLIGSLQALALSEKPPALVPWFAFAETCVALFATYLATISSRQPPFNLWMVHRRRAESLRQEYFRYLLNMTPYEELDGVQRRHTLAQRAADINRGVFLDQSK